MKMLRYFVFSFLFFWFRPNGEKEDLDEKDFLHCCGNFLKVPFWKLLDLPLCLELALNNYQPLTLAFWKTPNRFTILWTWINIRPNLSWSNIMKPILTKVSEMISVAQNSGSALPRTFHRCRWHCTVFIRFFFVLQS